MPASLEIPRLPLRLERLYGDRGPAAAQAVLFIAERFTAEVPPASRQGRDGAGSRWDERDIALITYADQVSTAGQPPLETLREFLLDEQLQRLIRVVHLLPFFPYTSDDGFSVVDFLEVDPAAGSWADVERLGADFDLMFDLVLNHVSRSSAWFERYLAGEPPYDRFFVEVDPAADTSAVVRPRSLPLLTPFETSRSVRHLWTTFSSDQIDLNYGEPEVLVRMIEVLLEYVRRGARIVRLDAVAFLWKRLGTPSIHLVETHEVVKLMRDVLAAVAPEVLLLTETNVPHLENISYFGQGDEAQMVYQFTLPPLLLDAVTSGDATLLADWLANLSDPPPGTTYFNFTASHDGIGVRPLEGIVPPDRLERLVEIVRERGGLVSMRRRPDGGESPYELNITYVDALAPAEPDEVLHARRFLATQAVMLALRGMPAVYFHSLVGTQNDLEGVRTSGQPRRINRRKFRRLELQRSIRHADSLQQRIYTGYRKLLEKRITQPALHPDGAQRVIATGNRSVLAVERTSIDGEERLVLVANMSDRIEATDLGGSVSDGELVRDVLSGAEWHWEREMTLAPAEASWLIKACKG